MSCTETNNSLRIGLAEKGTGVRELVQSTSKTVVSTGVYVYRLFPDTRLRPVVGDFREGLQCDMEDLTYLSVEHSASMRCDHDMVS